MIKFNLHTHSNYCDGKESIESMIKGAIDYDYDLIGISSHGPLPFETDWTMKGKDLDRYIKEVKELRDKYKDRIQVLLGLELDYLPNMNMDYIKEDLFLELDYWIGSIHYLGQRNNGEHWSIDNTFEELKLGIEENFGGNIKKAVTLYYKQLLDMVERYNPPIIGHLDLIKKLNKDNILFDENESWYKDLITNFLDKVSKTKSIIEINLGGKYRGYTEDYYPSRWIIKEIKNRNIPITISADAHDIKSLDFEYHESLNMVKNLGFHELDYIVGKNILL